MNELKMTTKLKTNQIFFAPVSSGSLFLNFEKSVLNGVLWNEIDDKFKVHFKNSQLRIRLWGIRDAKKTTFDKTTKGDIVFFYKEGFIIGYAKVKFVFVSEDFSKKMWGIFEKKQTGEKYSWSNIMVFEDYHACNVPFGDFRAYADYNENFSIRGYIQYREEAVENILKEFGSVESFIKKRNI